MFQFCAVHSCSALAVCLGATAAARTVVEAAKNIFKAVFGKQALLSCSDAVFRKQTASLSACADAASLAKQ